MRYKRYVTDALLRINGSPFSIKIKINNIKP